MIPVDCAGLPGRRQRSRLPAAARIGVCVLAGIGLGALHPSIAPAQGGSESLAAAVRDTIGVQPGDLIRLKVWREPDMSGDVFINSVGEATLPRLGSVQVAGWPPDSLRRFLVSNYAKFLKDPAIDVTVLPRVTILGAVSKAGVQNVDPTLTIADALALAGGPSPDGKQDKVELRRRGARVPVKLSLGMRLADTPVQSGDQLYVPQRNWLSRNTGVVLGGVSVGLSLMYFIFR
jgi:protein involved in polysaccharide export with SLBB domain